MTHSLDFVPLWFFAPLVITLSLLFVECGFRWADSHRTRNTHEPETAVGAMVASTLALLAFLLAFTFNIAAGRFEERRAAVLSEANAIGTTYLRADFLDDPIKARVRELLREYTAVRSSVSTRPVAEVISESEAVQRELWSEAVKSGRAHADSPVCALFVSSLNEVIDLHTKRVNVGLHARVPSVVWVALLSVAALSMTGVGYLCGMSGQRSWPGTTILITSFSLVILLVADLDRPRQGLIKTSQQPMIDLSRQIGAP